jgi:UDP-N-acetylmuramyl pentapeptide phosphotransferase/UDP-N-acetylglucosamine-1-phosphate transferase
MKTASWLGILLVVAGALILTYQGINYTREKKVIDMGPMHVTQESHEHIPLPPILGGLALVGGVVLLVMGARSRL